jgi:hypothetical protein
MFQNVKSLHRAAIPSWKLFTWVDWTGVFNDNADKYDGVAMPTAEPPFAGVLQVHVAEDLVLDGGTWHLVTDQDQRPIAVIEPPETPMYRQVAAYLEAKPAPPDRNMRRDDEARAATAICLRWGSYFAMLADPARPASPSIDDEQVSQIDDSEMARMNVEISAALAWWFGLCGVNDGHYFDLVQRAIAYLPVGPKTIHPHPQAETLRTCTMSDVAAEVRRTWWTGQIDRTWRLRETTGFALSQTRSRSKPGGTDRLKVSMADALKVTGWMSSGCPPRPRRQSFVTPKAASSPD